MRFSAFFGASLRHLTYCGLLLAFVACGVSKPKILESTETVLHGSVDSVIAAHALPDLGQWQHFMLKDNHDRKIVTYYYYVPATGAIYTVEYIDSTCLFKIKRTSK